MTSNTPTPRYPDTPILLLLWGVVLAATIALHAANLHLGPLNQDEGWYLYGARLVTEGQLPYVDFVSTQGPVMSFVYAFAYPLTAKWGVAGGRFLTVIFGLACALAAAWLAGRVAGNRGKAAAAFVASMASFTADVFSAAAILSLRWEIR